MKLACGCRQRLIEKSKTAVGLALLFWRANALEQVEIDINSLFFWGAASC
jgi:hypothetical protein